jgi:hypothetical protein
MLTCPKCKTTKGQFNIQSVVNLERLIEQDADGGTVAVLFEHEGMGVITEVICGTCEHSWMPAEIV